MEQKTLHRTIGRPLDSELSTFDLNRALADIRAEPALEREGRNAIILHKEENVKVVLIAMREGNVIQSHKAPGPITVQVLDGAIQFNTEQAKKVLSRGELLTLHSHVVHDVKALSDAAFLLTLSSPRPH